MKTPVGVHPKQSLGSVLAQLLVRKDKFEMVECGGVDSKKWCTAGNVVSAPRVEHARVEIGEGDDRSASSDDGQQRACAVWHPAKTHLSPFCRGRGIGAVWGSGVRLIID